MTAAGAGITTAADQARDAGLNEIAASLLKGIGGPVEINGPRCHDLRMKRTFLYSLVLWASSALAAPAFTDADLTKTLKTAREKKHDVIFYSWSPHMGLSQKGLNELLKRSLAKNVEVVPLLDPNCNLELAKTIAKRNHWPDSTLRPLEAKPLIARGLRSHYPSYILSRHGNPKGKIYPGYKAPKRLGQMIAGNFK